MKLKPKKKLGSLKDKLWEKIKIFIRKRDVNRCQKCNLYVEGSNCHTSHVIPVSHGNVLKFDKMNLKILCYHCHINWWHKNPIEASEWFKEKFPERWEYLMSKKEQIVKFKECDLLNLINDYDILITNIDNECNNDKLIP